MKQSQDILTIRTRRQGHHNITPELNDWLARQDIRTGLMTLMIQHVRASLAIRESADRDDLHTFFRQLEGSDDFFAPATPHYSTQIAIPVKDGQMALGTRQAVFVNEERDAHARHIVVHLIGE